MFLYMAAKRIRAMGGGSPCWALERLNWIRGEPATGKGAKGSY